MNRVTTLCSLWRLTLKDGTIHGFTDHDEIINFEGENYLPQNGAKARASENQIGFGVDTGEIQIRLDLPNLFPKNISEGAFDGATLSEFRHDWSEGSTELLSTGRVGDVRFSDMTIEVEWLGQTSLLNRSTGRVFSRHCDAHFGDVRCGLNVADFPVKTECTRSFASCRDQFQNSENFRGFPYLLGDDVLQAGFGADDQRDGSSRYR